MWRVVKSKRDKCGSLLDLWCLRLDSWLKSGILGLEACQIYDALGSVHDTQVYWVWKLAKYTITWARLMVESEYIGSDILLNSRYPGSAHD